MEQPLAHDKQTRGKTAPQRLKALDQFLVENEAPLLSRNDGAFSEAAFVDVGFGETPDTFLEAVEAFRQVAPNLRAIGIENSFHRVERAREMATAFPRVSFENRGFQQTAPWVPARLIRVMNVLRQYHPKDIPDIHQVLLQQLLPGGLLVEGTCDKHGGMMAVNFLRPMADGMVERCLLFYSRFENGFAPIAFRDVLPQDFRRDVKPGTFIHRLFSEWTDAWSAVRQEMTPHEAFVHSARLWATQQPQVLPRPDLWAKGYVLVRLNMTAHSEPTGF